jgi:hypothetical protein
MIDTQPISFTNFGFNRASVHRALGGTAPA